MKEFLMKAGLRPGDEVLVHSSFRQIRSVFPAISVNSFIECLMEIITPEGSLIMPAFTYCFKRKEGEYTIFDRYSTSSVVGAVSEVFRKWPGVIRTSSPTHSFAIWGKITRFIDSHNSPESPLGRGSVPDYLAGRDNSYVLLAGTDFTSLSFGHYLEAVAPVPWHDVSPWDYMNVERTGISLTGEQQLKELPGCSKSFISFQQYLLDKKLIMPAAKGSFQLNYIPVKVLLDEGISFFRKNPMLLLCPPHTCKPCDSRRKWYLNKKS